MSAPHEGRPAPSAAPTAGAALRRRLLAGAAGLAVALLPLAAQAGRAQVGIGMGTWATTDLDDATASASSWRDGLPLQGLNDAALPPDKDWARVSLQVDGVPRSRSAVAEAQAQARLRGSGQAFSGAGRVASDVDAGTLALQWRSDLALDPASPAGAPREAYARGYPFAELWETFEVVYPIGRVAPIEVALSLRLDGRLAGNAGRASERAGVEAYLSLGGVATGENHFWLDPVWRGEGDVAGTVLGFSGPLQSGGCSVARGVCSGFVSVYAALDLRGRTPGEAAEAWQTARAPLDLAFGGQLSLRVGEGVTLLRGAVGDELPPVAWAQVASVPEPATALSLATGGLALLALLGGRRRSGRRAGPPAPPDQTRPAVPPGGLWRLQHGAPRQAPRLHTAALLGGLVLAAGLPGAAQATYQLSAMARAHATTTAPVPGLGGTDALDLSLLNQPGATTLQRLDTFASTAHGSATANFLGRIGLLKAYAASDYAYCCVDGRTVQDGYADGTVQGRFYDELRVEGAGLAPGTPVSYRLDLRINGTVSSPRFESGGRLSADALAEARLRDLGTGSEVGLSWDASRQSTGVYTLTLATAVGHTLAIQGMLYAGTYVAAGALAARSAEVDFYHSAGYSLAPSVAGLNTLGDSGHDFLAPVPEPAGALLLGAGLAALGGLRRLTRWGGTRAAGSCAPGQTMRSSGRVILRSGS